MPNKLYIQAETQVLIGSEVGDDIALTSESVADGAGRQSASIDKGAYPQSLYHLIEAWTQAVATPTAGGVLRIHLKEAGGTGATPDHWTNDDGTGDIALSAEDKLHNCPVVCSVVVDEAAADIEFSAKEIAVIPTRHYALIMFNDMGSATTADAAETKIRVTPLPPELQ